MSSTSSCDQTPSPVRQVRQYEKDMEIAKKLQQMYEDEQKAIELEEEIKVEDEFESATQKFNEEQSNEAINKMGVSVEEQEAALKAVTERGSR